ncbi:MAG: glycosyltransferase family 39 protein [Thermoproteota archaeon]
MMDISEDRIKYNDLCFRMNQVMILDVISNYAKMKNSFLVIFFVGLGIRFFYFPYDLPLVIDGMDNFTYATAINYYGHLPIEWTPPNNGWPIFLSFWFSIINLENSLQYMQLQRIISIVLSSLITIPVYFLCRKFFDEKIALVGAALFAFDPRIILNSLLGITEPLFIFLVTSALVVFLRYSRRTTILSFILASFATIVRSEGIFLFFTLTILFFIKYRFSKEILKTYVPAIVIFILILSPIMNYRIEVTGHDAIFQRAAYGTGQILSNSDQNGTSEIIKGVELFVKYLGWIMIPNFLIFLPFGMVQFLRKRNKETNFIIVFLIVCSLPILYAYIMQAQDTRYFYFLYPVFCLVSLFAVDSYLSKLSKRNIVLSVIICGILIASVSFYEYKKIDYEKERELNEIAKIISKNVSGLNFHPAETRYINAAQIPSNWPFLFPNEMYKIKMVSTTNYENLESFIADSRDELTHLIVDDNDDLPKFLQEIYHNEEKYEYLNKVFDSKEVGFKHQMKLFKIDFQKFDSLNR